MHPIQLIALRGQTGIWIGTALHDSRWSVWARTGAVSSRSPVVIIRWLELGEAR
jgi:hypothetical protein